MYFKGGRPKDPIWKHFLEVQSNGKSFAKCRECDYNLVNKVARMKAHYQKHETPTPEPIISEEFAELVPYLFYWDIHVVHAAADRLRYCWDNLLKCCRLTCHVKDFHKLLPQTLKQISVTSLGVESDGDLSYVRGYVSKCCRSEKQLVKFQLIEGDSSIPVFVFGTLATESDNIQDGDFVVLSGFEVEPYIGTSHTLQLVLNSRPGKIWIKKQPAKAAMDASSVSASMSAPPGSTTTTRQTSGSQVPSISASSNVRHVTFLVGFAEESLGSRSVKKRKTVAISAYSYSVLSVLQANTVANVYGVVKFAKLPMKSSGTDFWQCLSLTDQSLGSMRKIQCVFFSPNVDQLPKSQIGQILRLHRVKVQLHNGELQLGNSHGFSWLLFDSNPDGSVEPLASSSPNYTMTDEDKEKVKSLQTWVGTEPELGADDRSMTLAEIIPGIYFDLVCQVVGKCLVDDKCVLLRVWDGTRPTYPIRGVETEAAEESLQRFEPLCRSVEPLTYDVCLFDDHIPSALGVKLGSFVKLSNLHAAIYKAAKPQQYCVLQTIELCIHHGTSYGRGIQMLQDNTLAVTKLREKLDGIMEALPNQSVNDSQSKSQCRDATNSSNGRGKSSGLSLELSMSEDKLAIGSFPVTKNTSGNKRLACDVQGLDSQTVADATGNTESNGVMDILYSESQAIQELEELEDTGDSLELSFSQSDLAYDPDAMNTLDVSPVHTRKTSADKAGNRKAMNKDPKLVNQKKCLQNNANSHPDSGNMVSMNKGNRSDLNSNKNEAANQNKVCNSKANKNVNKQSQPTNPRVICDGETSLEDVNKNELVSSRLRSNLQKPLAASKRKMPPDKSIAQNTDGHQDTTDNRDTNKSKAIGCLMGKSRADEKKSSHVPPLQIQTADVCTRESRSEKRTDRCMLKTATVITAHQHITPSSLYSVYNHPIVPNMFRVQAYLLDIMPHAQSPTDIIRLYCPRCNYLSFVPSSSLRGTEVAVDDGCGRSKPVQGRQLDDVTYYNCPDCITKRNNDISPSLPDDFELEYVFMLKLLLKDKSEWLSVNLWSQEAVTFFQTEPTEMLKDMEEFRFLRNKLKNMLKSGASAVEPALIECCIKSYYGPNSVCYQIFDTKIVL